MSLILKYQILTLSDTKYIQVLMEEKTLIIASTKFRSQFQGTKCQKRHHGIPWTCIIYEAIHFFITFLMPMNINSECLVKKNKNIFHV